MVRKQLVFVYRNGEGYDCTNGGITCNRTQLMLYSGDRDECYRQAKEENCLHEALWLNKRILWDKNYYYAEPLQKGKGCQMFGGNFVYSCDSRFKEMCDEYRNIPLPVHDRYETSEYQRIAMD